MAEFPALPLWTDAFIADTVHLTPEQVGVYIRLLMAAWRSRDCSLPDDDKRLATIVGMSRKKWLSTRPIMDEFFVSDGKVLRQKRLTFEREKVRGLSEKARASAEARWGTKSLKNNETTDAVASPEHRSSICSEDAPISISSKDKDDDDASARKSDPDFPKISPTFRTQILDAISVDHSGLTGRGGTWLGTTADMEVAARWSRDLGLTEAEQIQIIQEVMAKKRGGPPSTFGYFTKAMKELADAKAVPPLEINMGGLQDARQPQPRGPSRRPGKLSAERLNRIINLAIGE